MDIRKEFTAKYAALYGIGHNVQDQIDQLLTEYQQRWDAGNKFDLSGIGMLDAFNPSAWTRNPENEQKEMDACMAELAAKVKDLVLDDWASRYERAQMQSLLDALTSIDYYGTLVIGGQLVTHDEIRGAWDRTHPDDIQLMIDSSAID